jgi:hypothetical protein
MSGPLNVTTSADRIARFPMRIEQRVGHADLVAGVLQHLNVEYGNLCKVHDLELAVSRLRRSQVLAFTRRLLWLYGCEGGPELEACAELKEMVRARINRLFPEFGRR